MQHSPAQGCRYFAGLGSGDREETGKMADEMRAMLDQLMGADRCAAAESYSAPGDDLALGVPHVCACANVGGVAAECRRNLPPEEQNKPK